MAHEPKLTVYTIYIKPGKGIEKSNRQLFRHLIGRDNNEILHDHFIFTEMFRKFISELDKPEMFKDNKSQKSMTANQANIGDDNVGANIHLHIEEFIIEGVVEAGGFGRSRNKTSTTNKADRAKVNEGDAITDDFYFFLYADPKWDIMSLMVQSYTDDNIDCVMKTFWSKFFTVDNAFKRPLIRRFVPKVIIDRFRRNTSVSNLQYSTVIPGETLLEKTRTAKNKTYKVTIRITPIDGDLTMEEFEESQQPLQEAELGILKPLAQFRKKIARLRDTNTGEQTRFEIDGDFEIKPMIYLTRHVPGFTHQNKDFNQIRDFCFSLLEEIKNEQYQNAVQER